MTTVDPIDVRSDGSAGPTLVVLHGGPGAPGSVDGLARALGESFRVLEPLQRRSGPTPLSVARHVEDLAEVTPLPATLVGWFWGAMLALSFAARHPTRVRAIALIGCGTYDEASRATYRRTMDERLGPSGRSRIRDLSRQMKAETDPETRDRLLAAKGRLTREAQSFDLIESVDTSPPADSRGHDQTWQDVLRLQREGIEPAAFATIRSPVVMLHGDEDPHPGPATRDVLSRFVPQIEYIGFPRSGHEPWRERHSRELFLRVLQDWLTSHTAS